jgi:hypothetical protein
MTDPIRFRPAWLAALGTAILCVQTSPPELLATSRVTSQTSKDTPFARLTVTKAMLLAVRHQPMAAPPAAVEKATAEQVVHEQAAWKRFSGRIEKLSEGRWLRKGFMQRQLGIYVLEWETVADRNPTRAQTELIDLFLEPDIVVRGVDDIFMFARASVEGKDRTAAAATLSAVYARHMQAAIKRLGRQVFIDVRIATNRFDSATNTFQPAPQPPPGRLGKKPEAPDDLLPAWRPYSTSRSPATIPESAAATANYALGGVLPRTDPSTVRPWSPTNGWRGMFVLGSSDTTFPWPDVIGFDRRLTVAGIPITVKNADVLRQQGAVSSSDGLRARVYFEVQGSAVGEARPYDAPRQYSILFARIERIDILGASDAVLASIAASALPPTVVKP